MAKCKRPKGEKMKGVIDRTLDKLQAAPKRSEIIRKNESKRIKRKFI
jgi:hypothetical protein